MDIFGLDFSIDLELLKVVLFSFICGSIFGIERRNKNKSIGIRTNIFVCMGSALFGYLSLNIPGINDSSRVIAQIVTGIGFIGGGVIFKNDSQNKLIGLTTAALLWVLSGIGVMISIGKQKEALIVTVLIYLINIITHYVEEKTYKSDDLEDS